MLIGGRALQGLGAAFISPAALAIITTTFAEGTERAKALGVWAAIAIGGSAFGLIVGGTLTQLLSWPWIFFINVPIGIAVFVLSLRLIPESQDEAAHGGFDVAGAVTATGGLMTLVYAIVQAQQDGWLSPQTLGAVRARGRAARRFRRDRAAREGAARAAQHLPHPLADGRERR